MITQKELIEMFTYSMGRLYWNKNLGTRAKVGSPAGNLNSCGYYSVQINKVQYLSHRLIYLYHYGYMPGYVDHKHGRGVGDYLWNLRACSQSQNMANRKVNKNSSSGLRGVSYDKRSGRWHGRVRHEGKNYGLGFYDTKELASIAVEGKRKELHGRFYNDPYKNN